MADTHVILPGSFRAAANAVRVGDVDPERTMALILDLSSRSPLPEGYVAQTWSLADLATQYLPDPKTVLTVKEVLARYNLRVTGESATTPSLYVEGSATAVEQAFRPGLAIYRASGQRAYVGRRAGAYSVPQELAGLVLGVHGLDGRRVFRRVPRARSATAVAFDAAAAQIPGLSPSALANHYKFAPGDGDTQKIGIAEFGGAVFQEDLDAFAQQFGLGALKVAIKPVGKAQDPSDLDVSGEVNMDVQIIAGLCPAAEINVYFAEFTQSGFIRLLDAVIADRPVALSVSYGVAEDNHQAWSATALAAINRRLNAARLAGITVCVSTGDDGTGCDMFDGGVHVEFPSSSPYVLAVGGTELSAAAEVAWWDKPGTRFEAGSTDQTGGGSTGGGVSDRFARPAWQTVAITSLNPTSASGRIVPDVAALAGDPGSACLMRFHDKSGKLVREWQPGEGTSAAAPLWAALIARTNAKLPEAKRQRFLAPLLYQTLPVGGPVGSAVCTAIKSGNNASQPDPGIGYQATGEFSAVTGWGVPDGGKLLAALTTLP